MTAPFPDDVRKFVESTRWTFAKTYAATWPHEYVVRESESAAMILALARHIFEHGTDGRFYSRSASTTTRAGRSTGPWIGRRRLRASLTGVTRPRPTRRGSQPVPFRRSRFSTALSRRSLSKSCGDRCLIRSRWQMNELPQESDGRQFRRHFRGEAPDTAKLARCSATSYGSRDRTPPPNINLATCGV